MPLDAGTERPQVHAVGPDADGAAPPAGAERHHLVEGIDEHRPVRGFDQPFQLRTVEREFGLSEPGGEVGGRPVLERRVHIDSGEAVADKWKQVHGE